MQKKKRDEGKQRREMTEKRNKMQKVFYCEKKDKNN